MRDFTDNLNRDELRRQLRDAEAEHRASLPTAAAGLRRAFDPASGAPAQAKAALVGVPADRRSFLRIGGLSVAAGAILVACGSESTDPARTGGSLPPFETTTTTVPASGELDQTLVQTAESLELLAVATYDAVLEGRLLTDADLNAVATLFRDQHSEHAAAVAGVARDLGLTPYGEPNPYLKVTVVDPAVAEITSDEELTDAERTRAVLDLAYALENAAAQTYNQAGGLLSTAELRQTAMSIGATEARHVSVLLGALEEPQNPFAFLPVAAAVSPDAYIGPDGQPLSPIPDPVVPEADAETDAES